MRPGKTRVPWWERVAGWFGGRAESPWTGLAGRRYTVGGRKVVVTHQRRGRPPGSPTQSGWRRVWSANWYLVLLGTVGVALLLYGRHAGSPTPVTAKPAPAPEQVTGVVGSTPPGTGLQPELALPGEASPGTADTKAASTEDSLARMLERILSQVPGAGRVSAVVLLESTGRAVLAANTNTSSQRVEEKDSNGGTRTTTQESTQTQYLMARTAGGATETPVVTQYLAPEIRGVLVVADGAGDPQVSAVLYQAVQTVLGIPVHKIAILPRTSGH